MEMQKSLAEIVTPAAVQRKVARRVKVAEMLIGGKSYREITEEMTCSTAFVANVAKRLKAHGVLRR